MGWFPGGNAGVFPINTGIKLDKDKSYMSIIHYSPTFENFKEKSYIKLEISKNSNTFREIHEYGLYGTWRYIEKNRGKPFINADEIKEFYFTDTIKTDISAFAMYFHSHHLCKSMISFAITPKNDTINLLKINDWNFNLQYTYRLDKYLRIPMGSIIHCRAIYDNTSFNLQQFNFPPKNIMPSFYSEDEMMEFFILHLDYETGDEFKKIEYHK
jgi:hypothetical protein